MSQLTVVVDDEIERRWVVCGVVAEGRKVMIPKAS